MAAKSNSIPSFVADKSKLKASNGKRILRGIFYEWALSDKSNVVYTLKDEDHEGYPSLYRLYMEESDPTEYTFANKYLLNWDHWSILCETDWFKEVVTRWRTELEMKIRSEALARIIEDARNPNSKTKFTANKFVVERGWEQRSGSGAGRPSKDDIKKAAHEHVENNLRLSEDLERIQNLSGRIN